MSGALLLDPTALLNADDYRAFDWLESAKFRWHALSAIQTGQLTLWNPWLEGGLPSYAHPSDPSLSPFFVTALLFGPLLSMKIDAVLLLVMASLGGYALARQWLGLVPSAAAWVGLSIACSGWLPSRLAVGFYESLWLCVVPLVATLLLRCADEGGALGGGARWLVIGCLLLAAAGVQMQLCLAFALLQLFMLVAFGPAPQRASRLNLLGVISVATLLVALLGAVKFLPMIELLIDRGGRDGYYPRDVTLLGALAAQVDGLLSSARVMGQYDAVGMPSVAEYQHVGLTPIVVLLALLGMSARDRKGRGLALLLLVSLLLSWRSGSGAQFSFFELFAPLPVFSSVRDTARYVPFFLLLWISLLGGLGVQVLWRHPYLRARAWPRPLIYLLLLLSLTPGGLRSARLYAGVFSESVDSPSASNQPFTQLQLLGRPASGTRAVSREIYLAPQRGQAVLYEPEDLPSDKPSVVQPALRVAPDGTRVHNLAYRGEVWIAAGAAQLSPLQIRTNGLSLTVRSSGPADLTINQNFHRGWVGPVGVSVFDAEGLIGLHVARAWDGPLELRFQPESLRWAALLSLFGLLLCVGLLAQGRRARRATL